MPIDTIDQQIIAILAGNGRISMSDLAKRVGMSAPGVTERVRKLEELGVIRAFTIEVDPKAVGFQFEAIVRVKPLPGQLHVVERIIQEMAAVVACDRITGNDCYIIRMCLRSMEDLNDALDPLHDRAETNTSIVNATPVRQRPPRHWDQAVTPYRVER